jgi:membrane peptidoglycan carboxypeptidase
LDKEPVRLINDILSDNEARAPMFGLNSLMHFQDYQVAAKTGTTQDYRDGWIIGYTPSIVTGVWTGNNDNSSMWKEPGIVIAGPIWRAFMDSALPKFPKENFTKPSPSPATSTIPAEGQ